MSDEFKPITTQEELNAVIADRIKRAEEAARKPYADYEKIKTQNADYEKTITDLNDKIKGYETKETENGNTVQELQDKIKKYETDAVKIRVSQEVGLPYELAGKLTGETEDEIKKDAELFSKYLTPRTEAPIGEPEPTIKGSDEDAALRKVVSDLERQ